MSRIFDRPIDAGHPAFAPLQSQLVSPESSSRALGANLTFDHRVSDVREKSFLSTLGAAGNKLEHAVRRHHRSEIQNTALPEFTDESLNGNNFVKRKHSHDDTQFVHVLDLNGLDEVYNWDRTNHQILPRNHLVHGLRYNRGRADENWRDWLDHQLEPKGEAERCDIVGNILEVLGAYARDEGSYHPTWVTPWERFKKYFYDDANELAPDRWQLALGLSKPPNRWLAVIRHTYADLGRQLYRPTQLDAGAWGWHFPSPPWIPKEEGGRVMELQVNSDYTLLPEYIHPQLCHLNAGNVLGVAKTNEPTQLGLDDFRWQHRERLANHPADDPQWMPV